METGNLSEDYRPLILVAEDDDSNFKLIKAIIGKKCEILWAKNGDRMGGKVCGYTDSREYSGLR